MKTCLPKLDKKCSDNISVAEMNRVQKYVEAATSDNTRKSYRSAIRQFEKWGGCLPATVEMVVRYIIYQADRLNPRSIDLHITAIGQWHELQYIDNPVHDPIIKKTIRGIKKVHGSPPLQAKALDISDVVKILIYLNQQDPSLKQKRDIALLLTGFLGAFRRSELVHIQVSDLVWEKEGLIIQVPVSKTDQMHSGIVKAFPYGEKSVCVPSAIKDWLSISCVASGFIFRGINRWGQITDSSLTPLSINLLLKKWCSDCGFDHIDKISSHSFRRGMTTSASKEKIPFELIKKQGGWKTDAMVRRYIEEGNIFQENSSFVLMKKINDMLNK